jgi:flagellar hook protein FlgE
MVSTSNGLYVQGKMANTSGEIPPMATVGSINLPFGQQDPAKETTSIQLVNNLNSVASNSTATLTSPGTTNIDSVSGLARDGSGGTHTVTITGNQATQSTALSAVSGLNGTETLQSLGVTIAGLNEATTVSVDNGSQATYLTGLALTSTVNELISAINKVPGVEAELDGTGAISITRTYAGAGANRNIDLASTNTDEGTGTSAPASETIIGALFDANPLTASLSANNGTAHDMQGTDVFMPNFGTAPPSTILELEINETTGLVYGVDGLGGGNITIRSNSALTAGIATITTDDTQYSTSSVVYDSQGDKHTLVLTFTKLVTTNSWVWNATFGGSEQIVYGDKGGVSFNSDGSLNSFDFDGGGNAMGINPRNGAGLLVVQFDAGVAGDFAGLTGFASTSTASVANQDGYGLGVLDKIAIDPTGKILGIFTNGITRTLAQLVLANFSNDQGLSKEGASMYKETANSGEAFIGVPGETVSAKISSGALEASNVDLAEEFTGMIIAQRGYQANARVITISDSMLEELVNLKR